jgi:thymidylate synthase
MIHIEGSSADAVWKQAVYQLRASASIQEGRDQTTRELLHVAFTITNPWQRLVFGRPINPAFAIAGVIWIMAGANDSSYLSFWNPRMVQFLDEDQRAFHGAYGFRLGSRPKLSEVAAQQLRHEGDEDKGRLDQIKTAYEALLQTPSSRQVVLQIWDSQYDMPDPKPRSNDIPCNLMSHILIRQGKLEWLQVMRSNDLIWGTPYNFVQFTTMQEIIAGWLGVEVGTYNHISDSLHVYERHWQDLENIETDNFEVPTNLARLNVLTYIEWEKLWEKLVDHTIRLTKCLEVSDFLEVFNRFTDAPVAYVEWLALLTAEALRRRGHLAEAEKIIDVAGVFWATSWRKWLKEVLSRRRGSQ